MSEDGWNEDNRREEETERDVTPGGGETSTEEKEPVRGGKQKPKGKSNSHSFLHLVQHMAFVGAVILLAMVFLGSYVVVETKEGSQVYRTSYSDTATDFEDSRLFNQLLGNSVSDLICYGAIRSQLETDGSFDGTKEIDVTAFAQRYNGLPAEYITACYYLEDLIKWQQNGFEYAEIYMTGEEADAFLSRTRTVTTVALDQNSYSGGTISYLNSDAASYTRVVDVSGNILDTDVRDDVNAVILTNRYHTTEGKNIENYVSSWEEYYDLCSQVEKAASDLAINYEEYLKYSDYYDDGASNVQYYILRTIGTRTEILSNQNVSPGSGFKTLSALLKENCDKYIIYDPENMYFETNTQIEESTLRYILNGYEYAYPEKTQILIGLDKNYAAADAFRQASNGYYRFAPNFWQYLCGALFCGFLYLLLLVVLTAKEGRVRRRDTGEVMIRLHKEDRVPTELMILLAVAVAVIFAVAVRELLLLFFSGTSMYSGAAFAAAGVIALFASLLFSFFYYSFVRRGKAHTLWRDSLLRMLCGTARNSAAYVYDHWNILLRVCVPFAGFVFLQLLPFILKSTTDSAAVWVIVLLAVLGVDIAAGYFLYRSAVARQKILKGIERINSGEMEYKIDEKGLFSDNLVLARAVNNIGEGIRNAVATSMKDERLKADLITNVSHDIKTPLTSIINYVDLIKRENVDNEKVTEYIAVLDAKSQRLKQLTDDLVEASKISSGNIILHWERINLVELLNQTIGEFSEKFEEKALTPVLRTEKTAVFIEADSRRIWRVIENLFHNVFKYALERTRVYIDLEESETREGQRLVSLSIKNISANPIRVNTEELTERFIRGDESRTTEGSGLGLSIAKNLTEVQKGKFEIVVDGDLFKVILTFPLLK